MEQMKAQSIHCGTTIITETIAKVDFSSRPFKLWTEDDALVTADAVIVATGATAKRLNIIGEDTFWQAGISACAVCDGAAPIFRNKVIAVIGGGDTAAEEATYLTKYATKVYVLVRRDKLRASKVMAERLLKHPKVEILWNSLPVKAEGDRLLQSIDVQSTIDDSISKLAVNGLFYAIGHKPNTDVFGSQLAMYENGYLKVFENAGHPSSYTSIPGIFACGDVQDMVYRQAVTAAGSGCMAALDCERWLESQE